MECKTETGNNDEMSVGTSTSTSTSTSTQPELHEFTADPSRVMDIFVDSIYTNKDVAIRELISNASDAITKACAENPLYTIGNEIKISYDKEAKTLTFRDTGCGFTKNDFIEKLGKIAKSGTKEFSESTKGSNEEESLIGHFGVGFYSSYLISQHTRIITKSIYENKIYEWTSSSHTSYSIRELDSWDDPTFTRGTIITLTLKRDARVYLKQDKLMDVIKKHSSFTKHTLLFEKQEDDGKRCWEKMNWFPLWKKPKEEITLQEYNEFYLNLKDVVDQHIKDPPLVHRHFKMESTDLNFICLIFVPKNVPYNIAEHDSIRGQSLKLYSKGVLITEDHVLLYPQWMEFIKGIIDTPDIELNVSRQTLQNNKKLKKLRNLITKKVIEMMEEIKEDKKLYLKFYENYRKVIKTGIKEEIERFSEKEYEHDYDEAFFNAGAEFGKRMFELLKFHTSKGRFIGFQEYVKSMKPKQKGIYYIAGDSMESLSRSPYIERLVKMDYEVLYMTDVADELLKNYLTEYKYDDCGQGYVVGTRDQGYEHYKKPDMKDLDTKTFVDVMRDDLLLEKIASDIPVDEAQDLCNEIGEILMRFRINMHSIELEDKTETVAARVVNGLHLSSQLERLMKSDPTSERGAQWEQAIDRKKLLLSQSHPMIRTLHRKICIENVSNEDPELVKAVLFIYNCGMIAGGYDLPNANMFVGMALELLGKTFF